LKIIFINFEQLQYSIIVNKKVSSSSVIFFKTLAETVGYHFENQFFNSNLQARDQKKLFLCFDI
jgi:hypothetical protein